MQSLPKLGPFISGCVIILVSCLVFHSFGNRKPGLITAIDHKMMDIMFHVRGPVPAGNDVVIIDIDEKSLKQMGQWPWPRNILADLTTIIHQSGPRTVGFDVVFPEPDNTSPSQFLNQIKEQMQAQLPECIDQMSTVFEQINHDQIFGDAVSTGNTVLGYAFLLKNDGLKQENEQPFPSGKIQVEPSTTNFRNISLRPAYRAVLNTPDVAMAASEGFFNVFSDSSGMVRQVPLLMTLDGLPYPSLALELFRLGQGLEALTIHTSDRISDIYAIVLGISLKNTFIPTNFNGELLINYRGPYNTFPYISAADIINKIDLTRLKDKYVLIGSSSTGLFDLRATPFSAAMPGIEINANIVDNLLKSDPFTYDIYTEIGITYAMLIVGGIVLTLILSFFGPLAGALGAVIFFCASFLGNYIFFFLDNRFIGMTYPIATCGTILVVVSIFNYFSEGRAKIFLQNAFSHYVAPDVVSEVIKNPNALFLKGEQKELTVLFSDIRNFTSISEKMDSKTLGNFMNHYLTEMSQIIMAHGGTVDKFIGDAIMAFWGAPKEAPDHAIKAVQAALLMKEHLKEINKAFAAENFPEISIGVGINTGTMSVGNFGSKDRFDYTVMGDHVNLASRLEATNKEFGTTILISEFTHKQVQNHFDCQYVDRVQVKGKQQKVEIFEPFIKIPLKEPQRTAVST